VAAKLAARAGDFAHAERLAHAALDLLVDTDVLNNQATCLLALGEVLTLSGRPAEAASAFQEALELFERKGNLVAASKTRLRVTGKTESP